MKNVITPLIICAAFYFAGCHSAKSDKEQSVKDTSYTILGKITGQDTGMVYLQHRTYSNALDSVKLDHGYFTFKGKADSLEFCFFGIAVNGDKQFKKAFFLQNGKMTILAKKDSLHLALISGIPVQDEYNNYVNAVNARTGPHSAALDKLYEAAKAKHDKKAIDSLDKQYDDLDNEEKQMAIDYVRANPASPVSAYEIYRNFSYNPDVNLLDSLYKELAPSIRRAYFGRQVNEILRKAKLTAIGQPAPDFTANDVDGKPVSLSSFKGKYVLVDFWASWCGPCRRENPAVVKAYRQFHEKGFDIFGVSLDDTKADWLEAIKKDGLTWTQVSDLKGWKNDVAVAYGIEGIPMNFLLDKGGRIVAKGLRGEDLVKKLQELLH